MLSHSLRNRVASFATEPCGRIVIFILSHKLLLILLLWSAPTIWPSLFRDESGVTRRFQTWDSEHYLHIAAYGYTPGAGHCAFYPLWPLCIKIGSYVTDGNLVVSGYLLSNIFSFIGLLVFHRFVSENHCLKVADRATVLLALFPGSIFFIFPYTESLFLLLIVACLFCLRRGHLISVALLAFLLPLTRAIGVFIIPVFLWELLRTKSPMKNYVIIIAPLVGYACYFGTMYAFTGNPFEGFVAQQQYPAQPSVSRILDPAGFCDAFIDIRWSHDMLHSWLDRLFFVLLLASMYWMLRADTTYYVYSIFFGFIPALSNIFMSFTRFISLVFPLFIVWAQSTKRRWLFWPLASISLIVQLYFFLRHINGKWVG